MEQRKGVAETARSQEELKVRRQYDLEFQICEQACGFAEPAIRHVAARVRRWSFGRVELERVLVWRAQQCPRCGGRLARVCGYCSGSILDPDDQHCRSCSRPYRWALLTALRTDGRPGRGWAEQAELLARIGDTEVLLLDGDLTMLAVDAVVSVDDAHGNMVGESGFAVRQAFGAEVEMESRRAAGGLGTAWATSVNRFGVKWVLHVGVINEEGVTIDEHLRAAVTGSLRLVEEYQAKDLAMPAIGTGVAGFEVSACAEVLVEALIEHLNSRSNSSLQQLVFVLYGDRVFRTFSEAAETTLRRVATGGGAAGGTAITVMPRRHQSRGRQRSG